MRLRIALSTALWVGSVALAGCTATQETQSRTAETTTTRATGVTATVTTTSAAATTASYGSCPYYLSTESAREERVSRVDETLTYQELPPERRREFDAALRNGSAKLGTELPATWERPRIVRYRGDRYYTVANVC